MQIDKLINAINKLNEDSKPKWGIMNSSQMLWHCNKFIIFYLNEKKYSPNYKTYIFGSLHLFFLKYILRLNYKKYPKNTRALKFFDAERSSNLIFEDEQKKLIESLKKVNNYNEKYISAYKEMESICLKEYKNRLGNFPIWNFQESNKSLPQWVHTGRNKLSKKIKKA